MAAKIVAIDAEDRESAEEEKALPVRLVSNAVWQYFKEEGVYYCDLVYQQEGEIYKVSMIGDHETSEIEVSFTQEGELVLTFVHPTTDFRLPSYWVAFKFATIIL